MPQGTMEDLIIRVLSGEASKSERQRLGRWRQAAPENERRYQDTARVWALTGASDTHVVMSLPRPLDHVFAEAERRRAQVTPLRPPLTRRRFRLAWAAAAVVAVVAGGAVMMRLNTAAPVVFSTGPGEITTLPLADGSVVRLGAGTRLELPHADPRRVRLAGTAFFAVAPDSAHPFVVQTRAGAAEVLGTRFEIKADADSLRLVVVEGRVALSAAGQRREVAEGQMSRIVGPAAPTLPEATDMRSLLDWPQGLLIFHRTPLARVAREVGAHFDTPIVVRDTSLAGRTVTAWFESASLEEVVTVVCRAVGAHCTVGDTVEINR